TSTIYRAWRRSGNHRRPHRDADRRGPAPARRTAARGSRACDRAGRQPRHGRRRLPQPARPWPRHARWAAWDRSGGPAPPARARPPLGAAPARPLPPGMRDLASGTPAPALLPPLAPALARISPAHKLYGGPAMLPQLADIARAGFAADGIGGDVAMVAGALDGI